MDLDHGCQHHAVLPDALALFHHLPYNKKRDPECEVDGCFLPGSYGYGDCRLLFIYDGGEGIFIGFNFIFLLLETGLPQI